MLFLDKDQNKTEVESVLLGNTYIGGDCSNLLYMFQGPFVSNLIQIGPVTAEILLIWTNVPRTNVAWTNVVYYTLDNLIFVSKVSMPNLSLLVSLEVA